MFVCETLQETNIDVHGVVTWAHNSAQWRDNVWNSKGHNAAKQEYGMDKNEIQDAVNESGTQTITDEQYSDCRKKVAKHAPRETFIQLSNVLV